MMDLNSPVHNRFGSCSVQFDDEVSMSAEGGEDLTAVFHLSSSHTFPLV